MRILYLPKFARRYKKLPIEVRLLAEERVSLFRTNPADPKLKTHKLSGPLAGFWSFSINHTHRVIFDFADKNTARFYDIGTHEIYD